MIRGDLRRAWLRGTAGSGLLMLMGGEGTLAHGFGKRIDLPLPVHLYLFGAALAVGISCLVLGGVGGGRTSPGKGESDRPAGSRWSGLELRIPPVRVPRPAAALARGALVAAWAGLIAAGLLGSRDPGRNVLPLVVWVLFAVGGVAAAALLGNGWPLLHPIRILHGWLVPARFRREERLGPTAGWLAVAGFLGYRAVENVLPNAANPRFLAGLLLVYSGITLAGIAWWGSRSWLHQADPFGVLFRLLGKCGAWVGRLPTREWCLGCPLDCLERAPGETCVNCQSCLARAPLRARIRGLRLPGRGLFRHAPLTAAETMFVLVMLASLAFDGLKGSKVWVAATVRLGIDTPTGQLLWDLGAFLAATAFYVVCYGAISSLVAWCGRTPARAGAAARALAPTLLPIAVAYEIAHYAAYFLVEAQRIVPLLSDPLGLGWNLLGTAGVRANPGVVDFIWLWHLQVALVVLGHVLAMASAHAVAFQLFPTRESAVRSQIPMVFLMVGYTLFSLWLLAQPLAGGG